jgi:hypothetical protein
MSHRNLREAAKFFAGVVTADLLMLLWFWSNEMLPINVWGFTWTADIVFAGVMFDVALILILAHYAWHLGKIPRPKEGNYLLLAGGLFTLVAFAHLFRIFTGADLIIMSWTVPLWLSWIGTIVTSYLAYTSFHFAMLRGK